MSARAVVLFALAATSGLVVASAHGQTLLWSARYDSGGVDQIGSGRPFLVEGSGAVTLAGRADADYLLVRIDGQGTLQQARRQKPTPAFVGSAVSLDTNGRALWAGTPETAVCCSPVLLWRLGFQGDPEPLFTFTLTSPGSQFPNGQIAETAADGSVFLAYSVSGQFASIGYYARRLGSDGWEIARVGTGSSVVSRILPDNRGGALVTGPFTGPSGLPISQPMQRIDPTGNVLWGRPLASGPGTPNLISIDAEGQAIVSGRSSSGDFQTVKVGAAGTDLWQRTFDGPGKADDVPIALTQDVGESLYLTGSSIGPTGTSDYATLKYDALGNLLWARTFDSGGEDTPHGIAVDGGGSAWVTGSSGNDVVTLKYDPAGTQVFSHRYVSPGPATVAGVAVDGWGNATVVFSAAGDIFVLRYGPASVGPLVLTTVDPCRAFDSRNPALGGPNPLAGPSDHVLPLAGVCGVPATAKAVSLNVTAVGATEPGDLVLFPADQTPPATSVLNYTAGQTRANNATVGLGPNAALALRVHQGGGSIHVLVDVVGYWQ